ncbi:MAG: N-acetylmuramoyl-L-alanine amidase [Candidatus Krumholzibacteria bacterium]|nr:N-acetylmuramoyl-L-alanine amidase [Candidatus Krumholzibacteria bacterium]
MRLGAVGRFGIAMLTLSGVLSAGTPALAGRVERVRFSVQPERTRIVVDLSTPCRYEVVRHADPERLAINLPRAQAGTQLDGISVGAGGVDRVRVNRLSWGTQLVIDLDQEAPWDDFTLSRSGNKPDRIVVDLRASPAPVARGSARRRDPHGASAMPPSRAVVVAVDAGHGGEDPGTLGRFGLVEKKLTLDLARRVARAVEVHDGFDAVLTRNADVFLSLPRRNEIAEERGADVFVSIHLNSARNRAARGVEVFFVSPSGAAQSASQVLSRPEEAAHEYGVGDRGRDEVLHMLVDINQQAVLARSEMLAEEILESMGTSGLPPTRSVKQRSYSVLRTISMPSVLVEAGFISNTMDARLIQRESGRQAIADAIASGIVSFLHRNPPRRTSGDGGAVVVHRVERGETLWALSRRYRTSVASIARTNELKPTSVLRVGQELRIAKGD